jgi:hypothetical protein
MVAPPLVIVVVLVTVMVRVQPSSVLRERSDPLIAVMVISRKPNRPKPPKSPRPKPPKPWRSGSSLVVSGSALEPGAVVASGAVVAAGAAPVDGDGDAPIAATAPTTNRNAAAPTIPARMARVRPIGVWTFSWNSTSFGSSGWLVSVIWTSVGARRWATRKGSVRPVARLWLPFLQAF